jgi:UDP-GlcNAc:undecaprenyl-phosphate GlcNAc-1-phosphate transferase
VGDLVPFVIALGAALVLVPVGRRVGVAVSLVDHPGEGLKIHGAPVSVLGGIAVVGAAVAAVAIGARPLPAAVVLAVALVLVAGLVDDVRPLPWWARLASQAAAGAALAAGGLTLGVAGAVGVAALVVAVVAAANAVNLTDGQDGLAGGLAAIAAAALAVLGWRAGAGAVVGLAVAVAGALAGFLLWNRPPARIFLGNGGAYALGTLLVVLAAGLTARGGWWALVAAGMSLGVFVFELCFTVVRRLVAGQALTAGDRAHSYDVVAEAVGRNRSTAVYWGLGVATAGLAVAVDALPVPGKVAALVGGLAAAVLVGVALWRRAPAAEDPVSTTEERR